MLLMVDMVVWVCLDIPFVLDTSVSLVGVYINLDQIHDFLFPNMFNILYKSGIYCENVIHTCMVNEIAVSGISSHTNTCKLSDHPHQKF